MSSLCSAVLVFATAAVPPGGSAIDESSFIAPLLEGPATVPLVTESLRRAEAALARAAGRGTAQPFVRTVGARGRWRR
jgi:hypothetical protein